MFDMKKCNFRSQNLRVGRVSVTNQVYLITTVTHKRLPLFRELKNGRCVVNALLAAERSATTLSYVVMPDHLHWLMQLREDATLSRVMQLVKTNSAKSYNQLKKIIALFGAMGFMTGR
jgi:REP element-mobilizing transposase RayT